MPPPGARRPASADASDAFVASLESTLDAAAAAQPEPGPRRRCTG